MTTDVFNELMKQIALMCIGAVLLFGVMLMFVTVPGDNKDLVNIVLMAFVGFAGSVIGYLFGSSKGSADKNQMLKEK